MHPNPGCIGILDKKLYIPVREGSELASNYITELFSDLGHPKFLSVDARECGETNDTRRPMPTLLTESSSLGQLRELACQRLACRAR